MAETPEERLARLRREVEGTLPGPPAQPERAGAPSPAPAGSPGDPSGPRAQPARPAPEPVQPPTTRPAQPLTTRPAQPPTARPAQPPTTRPAPVTSTDADRAAPAGTPSATVPAEGSARGPGPDDEGWSLAEAIGGASIGQWVGIGLLALGGYLVLAQLVPGVTLGGSLLMAVAGLGLLALHFTHRAGPWALYAGAVLASVGALRVLGDLLPFTVRGETALGVGLAFAAISVLRHSQAGGYGWQGQVAVVALAWGGIQLALGLLPGSPGLLDLVLPVAILVAGGWLLLRASSERAA
jgi:hypothetical protein